MRNVCNCRFTTLDMGKRLMRSDVFITREEISASTCQLRTKAATGSLVNRCPSVWKKWSEPFRKEDTMVKQLLLVMHAIVDAGQKRQRRSLPRLTWKEQKRENLSFSKRCLLCRVPLTRIHRRTGAHTADICRE